MPRPWRSGASDDERPLGDDRERRDELGERVRRDQRQVDRQDDDRVGAAGERVVAGLAQAALRPWLRWSIVRAPSAARPARAPRGRG